jgi:hypothetical protein
MLESLREQGDPGPMIENLMPGGYRIRRTLAVFYSRLGFAPPIIRWALPAVAAIVNGSVAEALTGKSGWIDQEPCFSRLLGL